MLRVIIGLSLSPSLSLMVSPKLKILINLQTLKSLMPSYVIVFDMPSNPLIVWFPFAHASQNDSVYKAAEFTPDESGLISLSPSHALIVRFSFCVICLQNACLKRSKIFLGDPDGGF